MAYITIRTPAGAANEDGNIHAILVAAKVLAGSGATIENEDVAPGMVCVGVYAEDGVQDGQWRVTAGDGVVSIDGTIAHDGAVNLYMAEATFEVSEAQIGQKVSMGGVTANRQPTMEV